MGNAVAVDGLNVIGRDDAGREALIVKDVSFAIAAGEVLALIGESGSGKSTIALALMGYARPGCRVAGGRIEIAGREIWSLPRKERAGLRGRTVAYVAQSAAAAFNPSKRILSQVVESALIHGLATPSQARAKALALFASLALPEPGQIGERYLHQVSGGQLQRLMLAMALMTDPEVIILDEPTTALDVTTQIEVLKAFKKVVRERRTTALYVSHDLAVVAQMADAIVVLRKGEVQETGRTEALISGPRHEYTRSLLEAVDPAERMSLPGAVVARAPEPLLVVARLSAGYGRIDAKGDPEVAVLSDVDLALAAGASVGVIGESGSGKSTLARVIAGLLAPAKGSVTFAGRLLPKLARARSLAELRDIQIVFQMADTALNPVHTIGRILARPLALYDGLTGAAARRRVSELLDMVRLPEDFARRLPGELSGGQKQRVNLARALAANPKLLLCDEVTSGLDTVVGAAILKLLAELRQQLNLSYLFISHDLSTVRAVCDEVVILYAGQRVEKASRQALVKRPLHPYADLLLSSIPELRVGWLEGLPAGFEGEPGSRNFAPGANAGCAFFGRCAVALAGTCDRTPPPERQLTSGASILCHRSEADLIAAQGRTGPARAATRIEASGG